jgi:hypothetical protein
MVFNVRDKFDLARPVIRANSSSLSISRFARPTEFERTGISHHRVEQTSGSCLTACERQRQRQPPAFELSHDGLLVVVIGAEDS